MIMSAMNFANMTAADLLLEAAMTLTLTCRQLAIFAGYIIVILMSLYLLSLTSYRIAEYFENRRQYLLQLRQQGDQKTMIVLGSGGHTKEMLNVVKWLSRDFFPRIYVASHSDVLSLKKAREFEASRLDSRQRANQFLSIFRLREVGERMWVLIFRAPLALLQGAMLILRERPSLILCNGPGVCIPLCLMAYIFNLVNLTHSKIVFIESICRVNSISLTGRFLIHFVDDFVVQWEELHEICKSRYPRANVHHLGRLS